MNPIITVICAVVALICGIAVGAAVQRAAFEIKSLREQVKLLDDQVKQNQKTRNPYKTNEGLEDAMAIVHDVVYQSQATLDYVSSRMGQVNSTLKTIRSEPDQYDSDQPNRKKNPVAKK